jgi:hypothetical protein
VSESKGSRGLLCGVETCVSFNSQGGILRTYYLLCVRELKLFWDCEGKKTRGHGHFEVKFSV